MDEHVRYGDLGGPCRRSGANSNSDAGTDADSNANAHSDGDADSNATSNGDALADRDSDALAKHDVDIASFADANAERHGVPAGIVNADQLAEITPDAEGDR